MSANGKVTPNERTHKMNTDNRKSNASLKSRTHEESYILAIRQIKSAHCKETFEELENSINDLLSAQEIISEVIISQTHSLLDQNDLGEVVRLLQGRATTAIRNSLTTL